VSAEDFAFGCDRVAERPDRSMGDPGGLRALLEDAFRPAAPRLGILMLSGAPEDDVAVATEALAAHGLTAQRRLARLLPRIGEDAHRAGDVADFLRRYGHEYAVAWLPAGLGDRPAVEAAAAQAGCTLGWRG
jgi:hypothetical protein